MDLKFRGSEQEQQPTHLSSYPLLISLLLPPSPFSSLVNTSWLRPELEKFDKKEKIKSGQEASSRAPTQSSPYQRNSISPNPLSPFNSRQHRHDINYDDDDHHHKHNDDDDDDDDVNRLMG